MNISVERRFLSLLLAFIMVVSLLPWSTVEVHADYNDTLVSELDGKVTIGGSVNIGQSTITLDTSTPNKYVISMVNEADRCATGQGYTIKVTASETIFFSFDYSANNPNAFTMDGVNIKSSPSGSWKGTLNSGESVTFVIKNKDGNKTTGSLTLSNFKYETVTAYDITLIPGENGTLKYNDEGITAQTVKQLTNTDTAKLEATADSGYIFAGWQKDGQWFSATNQLTIQAEAAATYQPVFVSSSGATYGVGDYRFDDLNEAATFASTASTKKVVLLSDGVLPAGNYTIPSGVTLLIPFDDANTLYTTAPGTTDATYVSPTAYRTLTMASGANLVVDGALSLSAVQASGGGKSSPTGKTSFINMNTGSSITVNNGGNLYAWGYITGSGAVTVKSGGTVYECFQVMDWRGGDNTSSMIDNKNRVFPFSQYYVQNVEVPMTLEAGAAENGFMSINITLAGIQKAPVPFIGPNGMFNINTGYIIKDYEESTGRLKIDVHGALAVKSLSISMKLSIIGTKTISSSKYVLPINGNMTITMNKGSTVTMTQDIALLPGAKMIVDEGATCTLGSGNKIYVYDYDEWVTEGPFDDTHEGPSFCGTGDATHVNLSYPASAKNVQGRTDDAYVEVNGVADLSAGYVYTTEGGANICGTGKIIMQPGSETHTYQIKDVGNEDKTDKWVEIPIKNPELKNDNGSYAVTGKAASGSILTMEYKDGEWVCTSYVVGGTDHTHVYDEGVVTDPTCTEKGYTTYTCKVCGHSYKDAEVAATHKWTSFKYTWSISSDGKGYNCTANKQCTVCETIQQNNSKTLFYDSAEMQKEATSDPCTIIYTASFDDYGSSTYEGTIHTFETISAKTATCLAAGNVEHKKCTVCDKYFTADAETTSTAGAETNSSFVLAQKVHSYTGAIKSNGDGKDATHSFKCVNGCNQYGGAVAHTWNDGVIKTDSDCTTTGTKTYTCTAESCGATYTETVAAKGHTSGAAATCTTAQTCTVCGETLVAALGHTFGETIAEKPATCLAAGNEAYKQCTTCSKYFSDGATDTSTEGKDSADAFKIDIDANAHTSDEIVYKNVTDTTHDEYYKCCNKPKEEKVSHSYVNGKCACDAIQKFKVTWIVDGKTYSTTTVEYGKDVSEISVPAVPAKPGHTGVWDKTATNVISDVTITAVYTVNEYYYTIETYIMDVSGSYGASPTTETKKAKFGDTVTVTPTIDVGFSLDSENSKLEITIQAGSNVLQVYIKRNQYGLYTSIDNGAAVKVATYYYGQSVTAPSSPDNREGYTFSGWAGVPETMPANDVTVSGTFNVDSYSVIFKINGEEYKTLQFDYGTTVTAPEYTTPTGYTFSGWDIPATMPAENITVDATLKINSYTVTWIVDGTTTTESYNYGEEPSFKLETAKKKEVCTIYTFKGWDKELVKVTSDVTYTAQYESGIEHEFGDITDYEAPTCIEIGYKAYKQCTTCGKYFAADAAKNSTDSKDDTTSFVIDKLDHSYSGAIKSDGNGKDATHSFLCVNGCNQYGNAVAHTWNSGKVTTEPNCTDEGVKTYTCTAESCGATYTETVDAKGHTFETVAAKEATCLAAGNVEHKKCTECKKYFAADAEDDSEDGKEYDSSFIITALGHGYKSAVTAPTCTEKGYTTYTCSRCDHSYVDENTYVNALGHTDVAPKDHKCDRNCGKTDMGEHADSESDKDHVCDYCGLTIENGEVCADVTTDQDHSCDVCGKENVTEHSYTSVVTAPTCTAKGYTTHTCNCGHSYVDAYVDALGHKDENKDHVCDNGCSESIGECKDGDSDHDCDYGCDKYFGEHKDDNKDHVCDYGCKIAIGTCEDTNKNHYCDYGAESVTGCRRYFGKCEDSATDENHVCDYGCGVVLETCSDKTGDGDHKCDVCDKEEVTSHNYGNATCEAPSTCSECGATTGVALGHIDENTDHKCDRNCGKTDMGEHADDNKDHQCDYGCKVAIGTCEDADKDHDCDYGCSKGYGEHIDANKDHVCDYGCKVAIGECKDGDKDHDCDYGCDKYFGEHKDDNKDHVCDYDCKVPIGDCVDNDEDHYCDYGAESENGCRDYFGTHADSNTDKDHVCDYCGGAIENGEPCSDVTTDKDHNCDVCGKENVTEHIYGDVTYTWGDDGKSCIASRSCNCGDTQTATATVTGAETKTPTCTEKGTTTYTATFSEEWATTQTKDVADIPAAGHKYDSVVTAPTCKAGGYTTHTCSVCGDTYTDGKTDALGHSYESVVTAPTCKVGGYTTHTCSVCGDKYTDTPVSATGHSYGEITFTWNADNTQCTASRGCKNCDYSESQTVDSTSAITTEANCTTKQVTTYTAVFTAEWISEKTQTKNMEGATAPDNHTKAPTYSDNGDGKHTKTYPCCNKSLVEGHTYTDGKCVCNNVQTFTITWVNGNTTTTTTVEYGKVPEAPGTDKTGELEKAPDINYHYTFENWGEVIAATANATYTAVYSEAEHDYKSNCKVCSVCNYSGDGTRSHKVGNPTCTEDAVCEVCHTVVTKAYGHLFTYDTSKCYWSTDENGSHVYHFVAGCSRENNCNETEEVAVIAVQQAEGYQAPTCTADGSANYTATIPSGVEQSWALELIHNGNNTVSQVFAIDALGHDLTETVAQAATCTEEGTLGYWTCGRCSVVFEDEAATTVTSVEARKLNALGHDWKCTEDRTIICNRDGCSATTTENIDTAHTWVSESEKPATCTNPGEHAGRTCSVCGKEEGGGAIPELGHTYGETSYAWTKEGTEWICTATHSCTACTNEKGRTETATATVSSRVSTESTCTVMGSTTYTATFAETWATEQVKTEQDVALAAHTPDKGIITTSPFYNREGERTHHCTKCNAVTGTSVVPATGKIHISVLGDSITAFENYSNGSAAVNANSTLAGGRVWFPMVGREFDSEGNPIDGKQGEITKAEHIWVYQAAEKLGAEILVNNSWSGSAVHFWQYGAPGMWEDRVVQLHDNTGDNSGQEPDIIVVYMGTNDFKYTELVNGTYAQLEDGNYYKSELGSFGAVNFEELIKDNGDGTFTYGIPQNTMEAYAISFHKMQQRYPDSEIYVMTILPFRAGIHQPIGFNDDLIQMAKYFELNVVDIEDTGIEADEKNFEYLMEDWLHPNIKGMEVLANAFESAVRNNSALYSKDHVNVTYNDMIGVTAMEGTTRVVVKNNAFDAFLKLNDTSLIMQVKVLYGGEDITKECVSVVEDTKFGGKMVKIHIENVTDDIKITANAHKHEYTSVVTDPTCTEEGYTTYTCECGDKYVANKIAASGHSYTLSSDKVAVEATCTENAFYYAKCERCGDVHDTDTFEAAETKLGHSFKEKASKQEASAATCTESARNYVQCDRCDAVSADKTVPVGNALGHSFADATYDWVYDAANEAWICTAKRVCSNDSSHVETATANVTSNEKQAATCTAKGWTTYTATFDVDWAAEKTQDVEDIAALGHAYGETTYEWSNGNGNCTAKHVCTNDSSHVETSAATVTSEVTTEATCTADGLKTFTATFVVTWATEQTTTAEIPAKGHSNETISAVDATCTETGLTEGTKCSVCGVVLVKQETTKALGHDMTKTDAKEATCTATGNNEYYTCGRCNKVFKDEAGANETTVQAEIITALGHSMTKTDAKAATCTEPGNIEYYTCGRCDKVFKDEAGANETTVEKMTISAAGHDKVTVGAKAATCTEIGWEAYEYCKVCDYTTYDEIAALGHSTTLTEAKAATCTATGNNAYYTCGRCDGVFEDEDGTVATTVQAETIPATGHAYDEGVVTTYPTCTRQGVKTFTCQNDQSHTYTVNVNPLGHAPEYVEAKAPTCTEPGYKAHYKCSREDCGVLFLDEAGTLTTTEAALVENAKGHTNKTIPAEPATCTEPGLTAGTKCSVCNEILVAQQVVDAKGHTEVIDAAKAPTCTETGLTEGKHCSVCGKELVAQETVNALGHTAVTDAAKAPTCTETGLTEGTHCSVCNEVLVAQTVVAALGHTEVVDAAKAPTCTETGLTEGSHCSVCNAILVAQTTVSPLGHSYSSVVTSPTCTEGGYTTYTCSTCGNSYKANETPATGHTEVIDAAVEATCTETGLTEGKHCSVCKEVLVKQTVVDALGHKYGELIAEVPATCEQNGTRAHHTCSTCGKNFDAEKNELTSLVIPKTGHKDADKDHVCDNECGVAQGICADSNKDHKCDYGCDKSYGDHVDDNKDHKCDYGCSIAIGDHGDSNTDEDHVCDYGCGVRMEACSDANDDGDHNCDVCKAANVSDHIHGNPVKEHNNNAIVGAEGSYDTVVYCTDCKAEVSREKTKIQVVTETFKEDTVPDAAENVIKDLEQNGTTVQGTTVVEKLQNVMTDSAVKDVITAVIKDNTYVDVKDVTSELHDVTLEYYDEKTETWTKADETHFPEDGKIEIILPVPENTKHTRFTYFVSHMFTTGEKAGQIEYPEVTEFVENGKEYIRFYVTGLSPITVSFLETDPCADGHTPGAAVRENVVDSTCYSEGSYDSVVYCSVCAEAGITKELSRTAKTIEKKAHTPAEAVSENVVDSTCYKEGSYDSVVYCSVCAEEGITKELSRTSKTIEKKAHTPADAVRENEFGSTCSQEGSYDEVVYCSIEACKHEMSRTKKTIEKKPHTPGVPVVENNVAPTCTVDGSYENVTYCTVCKAETGREKVTVPAINHDWSVTYSFAEDGKSCTATRVCGNDAGHNEIATASITSEQTQKPSCTVASETTYTATFTEAWAKTQKKVVIGSTLEHSCKVVYEWLLNENGYDYDCEARQECENCDYVSPRRDKAIYVNGAGVDASYVERATTQLSCTSDHVDTYTAFFAEDWAKSDDCVKVVKRADATGHNYVDGECTNCDANNHVEITVPENFAGTVVVAGHKVTVTHTEVCRLSYWDAESLRYQAAEATENGDGSYTFTVPEHVTQVVLVVVGDINGNGKLTAADCALLNAYVLNKITLDTEAVLAGDVDGMDGVTLADVTLLQNYILGRVSLER